MASTNVPYYQKQKDLQEIMHASEQKRKQLEGQLQAYCQSDQKLSQLRAVKLQSYWRRVCDDDKRSRQRNTNLLRDLDNIETNMAAISARTHRLGQLKEQYFAYIDRTYPQWMELVHKKRQDEQLQQQQQQQQQQQKHLEEQQAIIQQQQQQQQQRIMQDQQQQQMLQKQQHQQQRMLEEEQAQEQQRALQGQQQRILREQQQQQQQQQRLHEEEQKIQFHDQQQQKMHQVQQQRYEESQVHQPSQDEDDDDDDELPPPLPSSLPPPITALHSNGYGESYGVPPEREYANLQGVYRPSQAGSSAQQPVPSVTVRMPDVGQGEGTGSQGRSDSGRRADQQGWPAGERDISVHSVSLSESVEVPISQPVQSVAVRQRKPDPPIPVPNSGSMSPISDDDISNFGDDVDLPSGATSPPHAIVTQDHAHPRAASPELSQGHSGQDQRSPQPDLSMHGLLHLLTFLDEDIGQALVVDGYYRSRNPDTTLRKDVIYKANSEGGMRGLDGPLVSMVLLQQMTPLVRRLPGACLLSDTLLVQPMDRFTESDVQSCLHRDVLPLWHKLLDHFLCLVRKRVMGSREVAYVFVPCLVHDSSLHQDKGVCLLEKVIEDQLGEGEPVETARDSVTQDTVTRSSQAPGVPALKFGSLLDSKPFSDDESSMITQSMNTEGGKLPANETEAYKHLVSGTTGQKRPPPVTNGEDTDNNSDTDDLEQHFVSTLSPRSHGGTMKSALGSTGSSHQKKLVRMISSDTDTELEIVTAGKKDDHEDDDFYDFYG